MRKLLHSFFILSCLSVSAQTDTVKIMCYNIMYYRATGIPCTHSVNPPVRDQDLESIVHHVNPDIFVVNELGASPITANFLRDNVLNTNGISKYQAAAYTNNSFSDIVNMLYYDSNKFVLLEQNIVERDKNNFPLTRIIDFYRLYYKDPKLANGADTVFFTVAAAHLKAGSSSSDQSTRELAAEAIMDYIDNNISDDNIILCGDLNVYSSTEAAYRKFTNYTSNPSINLNDPLNGFGNWNNNSTYSLYHTQSTHASPGGCFSGGGMDDRFDHFLVSDAIISGSSKMNYYRYRIVGQDAGNGCCNSNFNFQNNSLVPSNIARSLYDFSDHLPITLEVEIQKSNIGISEYDMLNKLLKFNNPVDGNLKLSLSGFDRKNFKVNIIDLTGKSIFSTYWNTDIPLTVESKNWPAGIYLLNVTDNKSLSVTKKLIKR